MTSTPSQESVSGWRSRYFRTRLFCFAMFCLFGVLSWVEPRSGDHDAQHMVSILCAVWLAAYLIAGLLKPLHETEPRS